MSPLLNPPNILEFLLHLLWMLLFVLGSHRLCVSLLGIRMEWSYAPTSFALLIGGLIYTIQSTAVALTGHILPPVIFWVIPLVGIQVLLVNVKKLALPLPSLRASWAVISVSMLFLVFAWVAWSTPFAEPFNGHHHYIFHVTQALLSNHEYPFIEPGMVAYDNWTTLWPPFFSFLATSTALPESLGSFRPIFIYPPLTFLSIALLCNTIKRAPLAVRLGPLLLVGGSYYIGNTFTDFTFDTTTPLFQVFFIVQLMKWWSESEAVFPYPYSILVNLWIGCLFFVIRPHACIVTLVFLLLTGMYLLILDPKRIRLPIRSVRSNSLPRLGFLLLLCVAVWSWNAARLTEYGNPFMPHRFPSLLSPASWEEGHKLSLASSPPVIPVDTPVETKKTTQVEMPPQVLANYHLTYYLSRPGSGEVASWVKSFFVGLAFPVWSLVAVLLLPCFGLRSGLFTLVLLTSHTVGLVLLGPYPKLPSFLSLPLAATLFWFIPSYLSKHGKEVHKFIIVPLGITLSMAAFLFFYNQFGHRPRTNAWTVLTSLAPWSATPFERLNDRSGVGASLAETTARLHQYARIANVDPKKVLLADHEPGALFPSLVGMNLSEVRWYSNTSDRGLWMAESVIEVRAALEDLGIEWVQKPGRSHGSLDRSLFLTHLRSCGRPEEEMVLVRACF
jgi:hypothetical protein